MTPSVFETLFGRARAKVYKFSNSVPTEHNASVYITEKFVEAAGTNLVDCVVTELQESYFVYTTQEHEINSDSFILVAELPVIVPVPEIPAEGSSEAAQEGTQP